MMKWKKLPKRILSIFMAAVMLASTAAIAVSAADMPSEDNPLYYHYLIDVTILDPYGRIPDESNDSSSLNISPLDYSVRFFLNKENYDEYINHKIGREDAVIGYDNDMISLNYHSGAHYAACLDLPFTKIPPTLYWVIKPNREWNAIDNYYDYGSDYRDDFTDNTYDEEIKASKKEDILTFSQRSGYVSPEEDDPRINHKSLPNTAEDGDAVIGLYLKNKYGKIDNWNYQYDGVTSTAIDLDDYI